MHYELFLDRNSELDCFDLAGEFEFYVCPVMYRDYLAAINDSGEIVGLVCFRRRYEESKVTITFIEVVDKYKNQGIGKELIRRIMLYLSTESFEKHYITKYEPDGEKYIKHLIEKESAKYGFKFLHPY